jgi:hypothetical protein
MKDIAKDAVKALADELHKDEEDENEYGWDVDEMTTSQTEEDVHSEEVDAEYNETEGQTPNPDNDEGSTGDEDVGTKQVSDAVTDRPDSVDPVDIGHLEINEYYRVWLKDPQQAPPEVQLYPESQAQSEPPTDDSTHFYDAPFDGSITEVDLGEVGKVMSKSRFDPDFPRKEDITKSQVSEVDEWVFKALQTEDRRLITPNIIEMVKSPLTLFYVAKSIRDDSSWKSVHSNVVSEIEKRGVEGVDKIRRADSVPIEKSFAEYDSFSDCVSQHSDKDDPEAYCAQIEYEVTGSYPSQKMRKEVADKYLDGTGLSEDDFVPNSDVNDAVEKVIEFIDEHGMPNPEDQREGSARANQLKDHYDDDEPLAYDFWEEIYNFHKRHRAQGNNECDESSITDSDKESINQNEFDVCLFDNGYFSDHTWGSDAGYEQAEKIVTAVEDAEVDKGNVKPGVGKDSTPDSVPEGYEYVPPSEDVPEGVDVAEGPQGATYVPGDDSDENDNEEEEDEDELASVLSSVEYNGDGVYEFDDASEDTIYGVVSEGDTVTVDASEIGNIAGDEIEGAVNFIDSDWVGVTFGGNERTVPIENVTRVDTQANEQTGGASTEQLNEIDTSERLTNAFEYTANQRGYRESGGTGGNTTGDEMEILEYQDGSQDYATPVDAYSNISTGVVSSPDEAVRNNRTAPRIINRLGGSAAQTEIVEDNEGREYIVKEGIEGETLSEFTGPSYAPMDVSDALQESATETMASAYFTGNADLHGGNMVVDDNEEELSIIDFDSGGYSQPAFAGGSQRVDSMDNFTTPRGIDLDYQEVYESIYDKAIDIREGNVDIEDIENTDMGYFMMEAANIAARAAYIDEEYDYGDSELPEELRSPPPEIDSIDDLSDPNDDPSNFYDVEFINDDGKIIEGEVTSVSESGIDMNIYYSAQIEISNINRLTEIKQ